MEFGGALGIDSSAQRSLKVARSSNVDTSNSGGENMLSFSSPSASAYTFPPPSYYRNAGSSIHGVRGPLTPSQRVELEQQYLIYKYIAANIPVPQSLLTPIGRSTTTSALPPFLSGSFRSPALGWGPYHLGLSGNADPEPGRCRRTDGKKWRCAKEAVADQKYCERHVNRGRHRSRKHVEGHSSHASRAMTNNTATTEPNASASGNGGASSNTLVITPQKARNVQPNEPSPPMLTRNQMSKEHICYGIQNVGGLPAMPDVSPKPLVPLFPVSDHQNPFEKFQSKPNFGLISTDSLLNPLSTSFSDDIGLNDQEDEHCPLRHFIDDWPKVDEMKSDWTQLSISISNDMSPASSSSNQEMFALSPLRLSREFNTIDGGNQRHAGWVPISLVPTIGGPLGEVLNNANGTEKDLSGNCSCERLECSPTGVLPKTGFGSLSGSSGSSPRAPENRCDDLLGSFLVNSSTVP